MPQTIANVTNSIIITEYLQIRGYEVTFIY